MFKHLPQETVEIKMFNPGLILEFVLLLTMPYFVESKVDRYVSNVGTNMYT